MSFHNTIRQFPSGLAATLATTLTAALVVMLMAGQAGATSDAACQAFANQTGWETGRWVDKGGGKGYCTTSGKYNQSNDQTQVQNDVRARFNHPQARAVYYGTPPAETGAATASKSGNQICIAMPSQEPKLTGRGNLKRVGVYGGDGYHDSGVVLTASGSGWGAFLHFGDMSIDRGRQCVNAKGRLQNAVVGTEFPVSLRVKTVWWIVDATDPNYNCTQSLGGGHDGVNPLPPSPGYVRDSIQGRCLQRHYTFRKMSHCAGAGDSGAAAAASCRIWVQVVD